MPPTEGFVPVTRRSPFLDLVGPLWVRETTDDGGIARYGFGSRTGTPTPGRPQPTRDGVVDSAPHRAEVNTVYNRSSRVTGRADHDLEGDAALRPVYILSFVLAHHLKSTGWLGASRLLVTSASSKASLGLAHALLPAEVSVVGLTSPGHLGMVRATRPVRRGRGL